MGRSAGPGGAGRATPVRLRRQRPVGAPGTLRRVVTQAGHDIQVHGRFEVAGTAFVSGFAEQPDDAFTLVKSPEMLARYDSVLARYHRPRLLEIGIAFGGSVAWLSLVAEPTKLVAIELSDAPLERLRRFIEDHGFEQRVVPHYGIDQAVGLASARSPGPSSVTTRSTW